jgi:hypothetical protein
LPNGFQPKSQFGYILGLGMDNVGIFYGELEHFTAICYILLPFGIYCGHFLYFLPFWFIVPRKIWQPCSTGQMILGNLGNNNNKKLLCSFFSRLET